MRCFFLIGFLFLHQMGFAKYYSQDSQDRYLNENYFRNLKNGVFVEIGAYDGITLSNTYFYESELDWKGICIEPIPYRYAELIKNRKCICIEGGIADREGDTQLLLVSSPFPTLDMLSGLKEKYDPRHLERVNYYIQVHGGEYDCINVKCFLLNDLLTKNGLDHVNYLSIDTEGGNSRS